MSREDEHHHAFSSRLAFVLDNPLRRRLDPPSRLVSLLGVGPEDVVVDFGCGPGYFTVEIARYARRTIGIDLSKQMLEKAHRAAAKAGVTVEFQESDGVKIQLPASSVELILLVFVYHEIPEKEKALAEFRRILRRGGRIVIQERTGHTLLSRLIPGPPVYEVKKITELAEKVGLTLLKVEPRAGHAALSLLTLRMTS